MPSVRRPAPKTFSQSRWGRSGKCVGGGVPSQSPEAAAGPPAYPSRVPHGNRYLLHRPGLAAAHLVVAVPRPVLPPVPLPVHQQRKPLLETELRRLRIFLLLGKSLGHAAHAHGVQLLCRLLVEHGSPSFTESPEDRPPAGNRSNRRHGCCRVPPLPGWAHRQAEATGQAGSSGSNPCSGSYRRVPAGSAGQPLPCARRDKFSPIAESAGTTGTPSPDGAWPPGLLPPVDRCRVRSAGPLRSAARACAPDTSGATWAGVRSG